MPDVTSCYCGNTWRATVTYEKGKLVASPGCSKCGGAMDLFTVRGVLAVNIMQSEEARLVKEEADRRAEWDRKIQEFWSSHINRMGFSAGWEPSYNVKRNGMDVLRTFPDIGGDDFCWLCNQIAKAVEDVNDNCIDNWRMCYGPVPDRGYEAQRKTGCCGFYDIVITNPKTGTTFCIGCNYGH